MYQHVVCSYQRDFIEHLLSVDVTVLMNAGMIWYDVISDVEGHFEIRTEGVFFIIYYLLSDCVTPGRVSTVYVCSVFIYAPLDEGN